jgi:hypothetical protein
MKNIFLGMNVVSLIMLIFGIAVGLYDLYLVYKKKDTISQKVHAWFPAWADLTVLIGIMALIWWILGPNYFVTVMWGVVLGHFFWSSEE